MTKIKEPDEMLTPERIQAEYGVKPARLKEAVKKRELAAHAVGRGMLVERAVFLRWVKAQPMPWEQTV